MNYAKKYNDVRMFPKTITGNGAEVYKGGLSSGQELHPLRSVSFVNVGLTNITLWGQVVVVPNQSIVLAGYDDSGRDEDVSIQFDPLGGSLLILEDRILRFKK